jgi:ABC-type amino acid transport substrate-binding protein
VIKEEDSYGSNTGNGSWNGMFGLVMSGNADIGVSAFYMSKERSEIVAFAGSLGFVR